MYKMLIIDDEYLVRTGIRETIDWSAYDVQIVGEATNGKLGLAMAKELMPDIIITDVKMPVMDGIQFAKELKEAEFSGVVIILSGYSDFDYARNALESGVYSYLLKPADNDELIRKVVEAKETLEKRRKNASIVNSFQEGAPMLRSKVVEDVLRGKSEEELTDRLELFDLRYIRKGTVICCKAEESANATAPREGVTQFYNACIALLKDFDLLGEVYEDGFILITSLSDTGFLSSQLRQLLFRHEKTSDTMLCVAVSGLFEGGAQLAERFAEAKKLIENRPYKMVNSVLAEDGSAQPYKKLVLDAMTLVAEKFDKNITIKSVADELYVSESHLMHIFKNSLGKTFNEYLTDYRILKAKEFLSKGKYRVNEVAGMVGYGDEKYFGQVFKKLTGMTPKEYSLK